MCPHSAPPVETQDHLRSWRGGHRQTTVLLCWNGAYGAGSLLSNRARRFALRLASLSVGQQTYELVGAGTGFGRRLACFLDFSGRREKVVLPRTPVPLGTVVISDPVSAQYEAEACRPGRVVWMDGSRLDSGTYGYLVVWGIGQRWAGVETFDAECAAVAQALEIASGWAKRHRVGQLTIFSDTQAAIAKMASGDPSPGQQYAIQACEHPRNLRQTEPGIRVEIRWCPSHKVITGNEKADEWARLAVDEPDAHGIEWMPLPASLAHLRRRISDRK